MKLNGAGITEVTTGRIAAAAEPKMLSQFRLLIKSSRVVGVADVAQQAQFLTFELDLLLERDIDAQQQEYSHKHREAEFINDVGPVFELWGHEVSSYSTSITPARDAVQT